MRVQSLPTHPLRGVLLLLVVCVGMVMLRMRSSRRPSKHGAAVLGPMTLMTVVVRGGEHTSPVPLLLIVVVLVLRVELVERPRWRIIAPSYPATAVKGGRRQLFVVVPPSSLSPA